MGGGDEVSCAGMKFSVLSAPGHTKHHLMYLLTKEGVGGRPCLFSGDVLFVGGCVSTAAIPYFTISISHVPAPKGRVFEGTYHEMMNTLDLLTAMEPETFVFVGHEYTLKNLVFGLFTKYEFFLVRKT